MPKLKTNKSASKRFKKNASGQYKHRAANRSHINEKMTSKHKKNLRGMHKVKKSNAYNLKKQLPYA